MSQWGQLQRLDTAYQQQLDELYDRDAFPMDVRHYLAVWIENQDWNRASQDHAFAIVLYQVLLGNLDIQHSRFVQAEDFLLQHNIRRFKQNFQRYQEDPCGLAKTVLWFMAKESEILRSAQLAEQVQHLQVEQSPMEMDSQRNIEIQVASLRNKVQCMDHNIMCLEEQQDEFDFKFQTHSLEVITDVKVKKSQELLLQKLLNRVNDCRKMILSNIDKLLDSSESLLMLLKEELVEWRRRQQIACIGAPCSTCLDQHEKWFTCVAQCLFQVQKFLKKLEELEGKLTYDQDPVKAKRPVLQKKADSLLTVLLKSAFVVETQPSMPQGKGPLVLRTNMQFSVKTRFLVKFPDLNHVMKVNLSIDREAPQVKGYRRFNILGTSSKALNMAESQNGGMVADFRHLTLKEQKCGAGKGASEISLSVTEELHILNFDTVFELYDFSVSLETSSLPVVIISNSSQQQSAWASILWFNMLSQNPKDVRFFASSPVATWPQLGEMLSWQFLSVAKRGLDSDQLEMIAHKLFGKMQNYDSCIMSWPKFSKENAPNANFSLWVWFDGILVLVKTYLEDLWRDGSIMGFVSKAKEKSLLKKKQSGTFLLRFSESVKDGGITFSWVETTVTGEPDVKTVQPFTKVDLTQIPFPEIIRNFQMLEAENVPVYPLHYLYPNTPKDEAFGKYYSEKIGDESPYKRYIKTKLVVVSKENTMTAKSPMSSDMSEGDCLEPINSLSEEADDLHGVPSEEPTLSAFPDLDPMLCANLPTLVEDDSDLQQLLDNFSNNENLGHANLMSDDFEYTDAAFPGFPPLQPCGEIYN